MSFISITFEEWKKFDRAKAEKYSKELVSRIPQQIVFNSIKSSCYAGQEIFLAQFEYDGALFSLIPGGEIHLGFDPNYFTPTQHQLDSFQEMVEDGWPKEDIYTELQKSTTPLRVVGLPSMLVETSVQEIGLELIDSNESEVKERLKEFPCIIEARKEYQVEIYKQYRISKLEDGSTVAYKINFTTHESVIDKLSSDGLRLLTNDEWEYVCGAGTSTLFRWGNDCPCDRYPIDDVKEIMRLREIYLSKGKIHFTQYPLDWNLHLIPNLFGLTIAQDPYKMEILAEKYMMRGGDGGNSICGGMSAFFGWLPLATSYGEMLDDVNDTIEKIKKNDELYNHSCDESCDALCGVGIATLDDYEDLSNRFFRRVIPC